MTDPTAAPRTDWRGLAWALLPPILVLLLRAALQAQTDEATASLNALEVATLVTTPGEAMWAAAKPFVYTLLGAALPIAAAFFAIRGGVRRHGWPRVRPWVLRGWLALCLLVAVALLASHLNRTGRQAVGAQNAEVLLVRAVRPSERSVGGAEVYVQLPGDEAPLHLLAEGQPPTAFPPKSRVRLQTEAGRWWGRWGTVTPLDVPEPPAGRDAERATPAPAAPASGG